MRVRISRDEWIFNLQVDRRLHLNSSPEAGQLIELVAAEVRLRITGLELRWEPANENPGYYRIRATIPCSRSIYDWLFNGPSGYRAHYYSSEQAGEWFNKALVERIASEIRASESWQSFDESPLSARDLSLDGQFTKLGLANRDFQDALEFQLVPARWVANCRGRGAMGLRAPRPVAPSLDIAGTWIDPSTKASWLSPDKVDRAADIYLRGYA